MSSGRHSLDALVVGTGPVGLALAIALARSGFSTQLAYREAPPSFDPNAEVDRRVYALALDVVEWLQALEVWPEIQAQRHLPYRRMVVWDAGSVGGVRFSAADYGWDALGVMVEHALLVAALWQAATREPQLRLVPCPRLEALGVEAERWRVLAPDLVRARVLLIAEGADSSLRAALGFSAESTAYGQHALVTHVATEQAHQDTAWQRFLPGGPLAFLPLADGRSSIVWTLPSAQAEHLQGLPERDFLHQLGAAFEHRLGTCQRCSARHLAPLRRLRVARWISERVALLGDAAHVVHPLAGQGLNLGLRDAKTLCEAIHWGQARGLDSGHPAVLRRYELERKGDTFLADLGIHGLGQLFAAGGPWPLLRGFGLTAVDRLPPLKRAFAEFAAGRRDRPYG